MKNISEIIIRYRSTVGIISLFIILYLATPSAKSITVGFFVMMAGVFFRAWSSGHLNKDNELATEGPYSLTRNPLYFGNFVLGSGIAIAGNHFFTYLIFFAFFLFFFPFLMIIEHKRLKQKFGKKYEEWSRKSNSFFPKIKRIREFNFNVSNYMRNREYRVLFFSFLIIAMLILKYLRWIKIN